MSTVRNEKAMASNLAATSAADEPDDEKDAEDSKPDSKTPAPYKSPSTNKSGAPSFFTIQKYGQGKWTRLGTLAVAGLIGVMTTFTVYSWLMAYWPGIGVDAVRDRTLKQIILGISILFLVGFSALVFWLSNKPRNVDFLIATDSEMKKVNWTTGGELMGSTRVVILFLFFVAIFLFVIDLLFSAFFQLIGVLLKA
jgi:preprotein translocase SecE subunit